MTISINSSVGKNGINNKRDIEVIQNALNRIAPTSGGPDPKLEEDGLIGDKTITAITNFQKHHNLPVDGRVDTNGQAIAKINSLLAKGSPPSISINFGPKADKDTVSKETLAILQSILKAAGLSSLLITSTARTPEDQARIMYNNIKTKGVEHQKKLYGRNGDKVIDVYVAEKAAGKTADEIKKAMVEKILELGPSKVSKHLADPKVLNVIDVAPSSISNKVAFEKAVRAETRVSKFLTPGDNDPAYHLEIPQPK